MKKYVSLLLISLLFSSLFTFTPVSAAIEKGTVTFTKNPSNWAINNTGLTRRATPEGTPLLTRGVQGFVDTNNEYWSYNQKLIDIGLDFSNATLIQTKFADAVDPNCSSPGTVDNPWASATINKSCDLYLFSLYYPTDTYCNWAKDFEVMGIKGTASTEAQIQFASGKWYRITKKRIIVSSGSTKTIAFGNIGPGNGNQMYTVAINWLNDEDIQLKEDYLFANNNIEKNIKIPGWTQYYYTGENNENYNDVNYYFTLSNKEKSDGNLSLKLLDESNSGGIYIHSDPIDVQNGENLKLTMSIKSTSAQRAYHALQYFKKVDGEDYVYLKGAYDNGNGTVSGGTWTKLAKESDLIQAYNYLYMPTTSTWHEKETLFVPPEGTQYVRISFSQNIGSGGVNTYYDNIRLKSVNTDGIETNLFIKNHSFEQQPIIPNYSIALPFNYDENTENGAIVIATDDNKIEKNQAIDFINNTNQETMIWSDKMPTFPTNKYELSFSYLSDEDFQVGIFFFNVNDEIYNNVTEGFVPVNESELNCDDIGKVNVIKSTDLTRKTMKAQAPDNSYYMRIAVYSNDITNSKTYVDDLKLSLDYKMGVNISHPYLSIDNKIATQNSDFLNNNKISANIEIYNRSDKARNARVIFVVYNNENEISNINTIYITIPAGNAYEDIADIQKIKLPITYNSETSMFKVFLWDDFLNLNQLIKPLIVKI